MCAIIMRKLFIGIFIFAVLPIYASEGLKGTAWTYTRTYKIDGKLEEFTSNFVFLTETEVVWLLETHTGTYLFPIAMGVYDSRLQTITFAERSNSFQKSWSGTDVVVYFNPDDKVMQFHFFATTNDRVSFYLNNGKPVSVQQIDMPDINDHLVNTSWKGAERGGSSITLNFISPTELYLNSQRCLYISIGDKVAFIVGDNFSDEVLAGTWKDDDMLLFRKGSYKSVNKLFAFTRVKF